MANLKKSLKNKPNVNSAALEAASVESAVTKTCALTVQVNTFLNYYLKPHLNPNQKVLLALSGGLDSTVLMHLLAESKKSLSFELYALHVHHGLSANANDWAAFCLNQCEKLGIPLQVVYVKVDIDSPLGLEAAARALRYEALFSCKLNSDDATNAKPDYIVTAHHQDDQAETLLLQLFRGAGVKGLASMAAVDSVKGLLRPLLGLPRQLLQEYAELHHLAWCEDESNDDTQYERNFVRHEVLPMLEKRHHAIKSVLARAASHLAEANHLLNDLAAIDTEPLLVNNSLCLIGLSALATTRAKNSLRWWFANNQLAMPTSEHLDEVLQQLLYAKQDANINIVLQNLTLKRYQNRGYLSPQQHAQVFDLVWNGEPELTLPNGGQLVFKQVIGAGLALKFGMTKLRITHRAGGERFKPNALRPTRTLKHLLQEANIPPWRRETMPLVYWQDTLAYVPEIGIAHELQAIGQEPGIEITWFKWS